MMMISLPRTVGTGVTRGGRNGMAYGMATKRLVYSNGALCPSSLARGWWAWWLTTVRTNLPPSEKCREMPNL